MKLLSIRFSFGVCPSQVHNTEICRIQGAGPVSWRAPVGSKVTSAIDPRIQGDSNRMETTLQNSRMMQAAPM
jgi:hypothetical protein